MLDLSVYFTSITAMAALAVLITAWINAKIVREFVFLGLSSRQLVSWAVCIGLAFLGQWKALGLFADANTVWTLINGIGIGLVANGIFSIEFVQSILAFLKLKP